MTLTGAESVRPSSDGSVCASAPESDFAFPYVESPVRSAGAAEKAEPLSPATPADTIARLHKTPSAASAANAVRRDTVPLFLGWSAGRKDAKTWNCRVARRGL